MTALRNKPLNLTELAAAMGYKGITAKLTKTVKELASAEVIVRTADEDGGTKFIVNDI